MGHKLTKIVPEIPPAIAFEEEKKAIEEAMDKIAKELQDLIDGKKSSQ